MDDVTQGGRRQENIGGAPCSDDDVIISMTSLLLQNLSKNLGAEAVAAPSPSVATYQGGSSAKDHRNHNKYVFRSSSISTEKISRCRVNFLIMPRSPTKFPSLLKCTQVWHQVLKSQGNSSWNPPNLYLGHSCLIFLNALLLAERTLKKHSMSKLDVPTQTVIL